VEVIVGTYLKSDSLLKVLCYIEIKLHWMDKGVLRIVSIKYKSFYHLLQLLLLVLLITVTTRITQSDHQKTEAALSIQLASLQLLVLSNLFILMYNQKSAQV